MSNVETVENYTTDSYDNNPSISYFHLVNVFWSDECADKIPTYLLLLSIDIVVFLVITGKFSIGNHDGPRLSAYSQATK